MKNTRRSSDFIAIKHRIESCEKMEKLESVRQIVTKYGEANKDGADLQNIFNLKEYELSVDLKNEREFQKRNRWRDLEEDSQESLYHQLRCGGHSTY